MAQDQVQVAAQLPTAAQDDLDVAQGKVAAQDDLEVAQAAQEDLEVAQHDQVAQDGQAQVALPEKLEEAVAEAGLLAPTEYAACRSHSTAAIVLLVLAAGMEKLEGLALQLAAQVVLLLL